MSRAPKKLEIFWRDENYGSVSGSHSFRCYDLGDLSDTAHAKMLRTFRKHGFEMNHQRCTYIAEDAQGKDNALRMVEALEAAGWELTHRDCVPAMVEAHAATQGTDAAETDAEDEAPAFRP